MELPENKLAIFIQGDQKAKWRTVNNHNINSYTEDEIERITRNYNTPIGKGAFGEVYQGFLDDGSPVAVKKYICQNLKEGFAKEMTVHCQINHRNVVRLLGYCSEENALMMVTEYISGGDLRNLLHDSDDPISLATRLHIAIQCAEALVCLHSMYQPIIHGDIKPDNILLDGKFGAKLSDFGISRLLFMDNTQYTMHVTGSRGYIDPEHLETGRVDPKNDVYSFGVVLVELFTRKKVAENGISTYLTRDFTEAIEKGKKARGMFDTEIATESNMKVLDKIGKLAVGCLRRDIKKRLEMKDVTERLRSFRKVHDQHVQQNTGEHTSISSSNTTLLYKLNSFDIFNRNAQRNFVRNGGPLLENVDTLRIFTQEELSKITANYSNLISKGSSDKVYKGILEDNTFVRVKTCIMVHEAQKHQFHQQFVQRPFAYQEFVTDRYGHKGSDERQFLNYRTLHENFADQLIFRSRILHQNIIRLLGCCLEMDVPMLVYEFATTGTLQEFIRGSYNFPLGMRLDIAIGSANALAYLHSVMSCTCLHGNVKSRSILLDSNLVPKVSHIVFTRLAIGALASHEEDTLDLIYPERRLMPRPVEGTLDEHLQEEIAYTDPIFFKKGVLTQKYDVYSFGIVLLELITRKRVIYGNSDSLQSEFMQVYEKEKSGSTMFDKAIAVEGDTVVLEEIGRLAIDCFKEDTRARPDMAEVAERLRNLRRGWKPST